MKTRPTTSRALLGAVLWLAGCGDAASSGKAGSTDDAAPSGPTPGGTSGQADVGVPFLPETCANGLRDDGEDGVDCGGGCPLCPVEIECHPADCAPNSACLEYDCAEGACPRRECRPYFADCETAACAAAEVCRTFQLIGQGTLAEYAYCTARAAPGAKCYDQCSEGEFCDLDTGDCRPLLTAGMPCVHTEDHCTGGTRCANTTCELPVPEGGECAGDTFCDTGLLCRDFVCVPRVAFGGECAPGECADGQWCAGAGGEDGVAGVCRALRPAGEGCVGAGGCVDGSVCASPLAGEGQCMDDAACGAGHCCPVGGVNLCVPADDACETVLGLCVDPVDAERTAACGEADSREACVMCCGAGSDDEVLFLGGESAWYCECHRAAVP